MRDFEPETITERIAVVVMELANGEAMTTRDVAELLGVSRSAAWRIMCRLCRVPSLSLTKIDDLWQKLPPR
jgi:alkylated DNA nucleotide flippase Atl1